MELLKVQSVTKDYGEGKGLFDFSMNLQKGDIVGLIGINGAGKTTLLNILSGNIHPNKGKVFYEGEEMTIDSERRKNFGVSVNPEFYPYLTAYENLEAVLFLNGVQNHKKMEDEIQRVLNIVGLRGSEHKKVKPFSFGMKQRLGFAQAILNADTLMLLDEPFVGLDIHGRNMVKDFIREMVKTREMAVIFSDHNLDEVKSLCNRLVVIKDGVKRYDGDIHIQSPIVLNVECSALVDSRYAEQIDEHRLLVTEDQLHEKLQHIGSVTKIRTIEKIMNPLESFLEEGENGTTDKI
ncbi:putative bacitracin ABC transporter, ATP-binding protein BcrA [Aedoeadaptatus coxii]|uniref:Putative bacitracin ABC transporter, ATP-binding protein BcrA n=1 Tax=Aedoeadaptatus coxii TaxID=755172 RepID=A0A134AJ35_9FIRM|nr:ABC transporter ATP-binding protein [Peptoniphilus coxii]KXB67741.1 putative bacitracin ABC transporter, ATP-binding protein BcrA [Peptoniphilus coxii]